MQILPQGPDSITALDGSAYSSMSLDDLLNSCRGLAPGGVSRFAGNPGLVITKTRVLDGTPVELAAMLRRCLK